MWLIYLAPPERQGSVETSHRGSPGNGPGNGTVLRLLDSRAEQLRVWARADQAFRPILWGSSANPFDPARGVPFAAWLRRIAHRLLLDALGERGRLTQVPEDEEGNPDESLFVDSGLPADGAERAFLQKP